MSLISRAECCLHIVWHGHMRSAVPLQLGRDKVQRSLLNVRDGPSAEEIVGLAFKGELFSWHFAHDS
jgi:hypothetical protein